jgi:hypothetical protein
MNKKNKANLDKEMLEELKQNHDGGPATAAQIYEPFDAVSELEKMLTEEINKDILNTLMFASNVSKWKAINRDGQIDSILEDKPFTPIIIEETDEYKMLSSEHKENYKKYGKILCNTKPKK